MVNIFVLLNVTGKEKLILIKVKDWIKDLNNGVAKLIIKEFDVILILEQWNLTNVQLKC